jgi:outer membrane lipoprotein SlyB
MAQLKNMKHAIFAAVLAASLIPAEAQLFSRESLGGAALGGLAGGIIGHNSGRRTAEGAAIGAGAGLLLGAITHNARRDYYGVETSVAPAPYYYEPRPNYAVTGLALGGLAGGVIGHNSGRRTAEGLAIGAGAGLLFGSMAEHDARRRVQYVQYVQPAPAYVVSQPQPAPAAPEPAAPTPAPTQQVPAINNYSGSASQMVGANALFGR